MAKYLFVVIGLTAAGMTASGQSRSDEVDAYRLALRAVVPIERAEQPQRFALHDSTINLGARWRQLESEELFKPLHPRTRATYAKRETIEDFLKVSASSRSLPRELHSLREFFLVPSSVRLVDAQGRWSAFAQRNQLVPGSSVAVSRIGFDSTRSQAFVYVSYVCGSLCGHEMFVLTERDSSGWHVLKVNRYGEY